MAESAAKVFIYANSNKITYGIKKFIIDDESGLSELPKDAHVGSSCLVISTGDVYVLNSKQEWKKVSGGSSGGGGSDDGGDQGGDDGGDQGGDTPGGDDDDDDITEVDGGEVI